jgi:glutamate racemase
VSKWDEVAVRLLDRGVSDLSKASTDDILAVLEEIHDKVDFDESLKNADPLTKNIAVGILGTAYTLVRRFASRDLVEKFTYEKVLEQARKRGMENVERYLVSYPNLTKKLIDWLRCKLVDGFKT